MATRHYVRNKVVGYCAEAGELEVVRYMFGEMGREAILG